MSGVGIAGREPRTGGNSGEGARKLILYAGQVDVLCGRNICKTAFLKTWNKIACLLSQRSCKDACQNERGVIEIAGHWEVSVRKKI